MVAALVVGGWFASAAIKKLADKIGDYLEGQYKYGKGVKDDLKKLQQNLTGIQAVIHAAEQQTQIQNPALATWLRDLKDAAFDAEDLLDKFDYQLLEAKVKEQNKVRRSFASSSSSTSHNILKRAKALAKRLFFSDDDHNKLREIVRSFDGIFARTGDFLKLLEINASVSNRRQETLELPQTTSMPVEPEIVGREIVRNDILNSLVRRRTDDSRSSNIETFSVLSIVGIGGVGKTTVAQHVFNSNQIKEHFDLKIWVCVSHTFGVRRLAIEMIESASKSRPMDLHQCQNLDMIQGILKKELQDKRFLIVLDDMWNEVRSKWEDLCKPFHFGKEGSRIVVTTRSHKVAAAVGAKETVDLEGLAEEDFWTFFKQCAFGDKIREHHPKLELIGREIAKKLGGLPLAAKTVGSILNSKLEEEHWRGILKSKLWEIEQQEDGIMPALKLSYDHLPPHLKQCFAYCSLFPKGFLFCKENVVQVWMAQGLVPCHEERKRAEDIGVQYFDYLLQRCFFQKAAIHRSSYTIHDLLHDLAESVIDDECCRIETDGPVQIPKRARHLCIAATNHQLETCENMCDIKKLRSLVVAGKLSFSEPSNSGLVRFIECILKESKQLRVLIFYNTQFHLPLEAIGDLVHLRYIEIISCHMLELPTSWCKLYHLQALNVSLFLGMTLALPKDVSNCINLRHLNYGSIDSSQVDRIGKLTSLQELMRYDVGKKHGHNIGQLRNLRQLRGYLSIHNLNDVRNKEEASEAMLHNKENLQFLSLVWTYRVQDHMADKYKEIIEGLRPHINLKGLNITSYGGITSPRWLSKTWLFNLESIELTDCYAWTILPPLGQLPFLKLLYLKGMNSVKRVGIEFYGNDDDDIAFQSLEKLKFENMDEWEEWSGPGKGQLSFPCLRQLVIYYCPKLQTLVLPTQFKEVELFWQINNSWEMMRNVVPSPSMPEILIDYKSRQSIRGLSKEVLASIKYLHFNDHNDITSFIEKEEKWFQKLTSLKELIFYNCSDLQSFPANMINLTSLEILKTIECPNIKSLPKKGLPTSLKELYIKPCKKELEAQCQMGDGCDWPKISYIPHITIGETIIRYVHKIHPISSSSFIYHMFQNLQ